MGIDALGRNVSSFGSIGSSVSVNTSTSSNSVGTGSEASAFSAGAAKDKTFADELQKAYGDKDKEKLKKVCSQFESIMLSMMYKQMKATVGSSDISGDSNAKETFEGMLDDELMTRAGTRGVGLGDVLYKQLSKSMDKMYTPKSVSNQKVQEDESGKNVK